MLHCQKRPLWGACLLLSAATSESFNVAPQQRGQPTKFESLSAQVNNGLVAGAVAAVLLTANPAPAVAGDEVVGTPLEAAIVQISAAAYPVLDSLSDVSPLSNKFVNIIDKKISVSKATEALDKGIDSFLSIPDDKVLNFASTLETSYQGVSGETCTAVTGTGATAERFASLPAVQGLDGSKVKSLQERFAPANKAVPKTATGDICMPPSSKGLEQLWIGQTELTLNIPKPESKAFVGSFSSAVSSVPNPEWLRLLPEVKKTFTSNVDPKTAVKFEKAGKALEKAFQGDARIQKRLSSS